jgi:hypothetical protein
MEKMNKFKVFKNIVSGLGLGIMIYISGSVLMQINERNEESKSLESNLSYYHYKKAENSIDPLKKSFQYNQAVYLQMISIYNRNKSLIDSLGIKYESDKDVLDKIENYSKKAEYPIPIYNSINFSKADYLLTEEIRNQQNILIQRINKR